MKFHKMGVADCSENGADEAKMKCTKINLFLKTNIYHHEIYSPYNNVHMYVQVVV